jgi:hypothetical protein
VGLDLVTVCLFVTPIRTIGVFFDFSRFAVYSSFRPKDLLFFTARLV